MKVCNYLFISELREFFEVKRIMHNCFLYGSQGRTSRGPVTVRLQTWDGRAHERPKSVAGHQEDCGPGTARPRTRDAPAEDLRRERTLGIENRCRSVEVMLQVSGGYVAGPGNVWGPGTVWPRTGDEKGLWGPRTVAGPGGKCGPVTVWPGTGDGKANSKGPTKANSKGPTQASKDPTQASGGPIRAGGSGSWRGRRRRRRRCRPGAGGFGRSRPAWPGGTPRRRPGRKARHTGQGPTLRSG